MRPLLLAAAVAVLTVGCGYRSTGQTRTTMTRGHSERIYRFNIEDGYAYIVDPASRTCALRHVLGQTMAMIPIDCAGLKAGVPEIAGLITWVAPVPAATPTP
jgi:hypothetical protein